MGTKKTLVIVPVFNEADALIVVLPALKVVVASFQTVDIIVMCNGSTDGSADVAEGYGVRAYRQSSPGKPEAVRNAFLTALAEGYDQMIIFDGDGQHPAEAVATMLQLLEEHSIVKGSRFLQDSRQIGTPLDRRMVGVATRAWVKDFTGTDYTDPPCGLVGLKAKVAELLTPNLGWGEEWEIELLFALAHNVALRQYKVLEFPIPAIYEHLPGEKQKKKYDPAAWDTRLSERLTRQACAIRRFVTKYCP